MEKFDVIILAGQSNAEGYGIGDCKKAYKENGNIYILKDKNRRTIDFDEKGVLRVGKEFEPEIEIAKEKVEKGVIFGNFSLAFAEKYVNNGYLKQGRKLLIVYTAIGGTGFAKHQWGNTAILQDRMFKMIDYALSLNNENRIVAFLWHQGEHDAFENAEFSKKTRELYYYDKFSYLIKQVKEKYGKDVPVIAGGFSSEWVNGGYQEQCEAVSRATKRVLKDNGGSFVKTDDLLSNNQRTQNGDSIHFSRQSLYYLGNRYFNAYKKIKDGEL